LVLALSGSLKMALGMLCQYWGNRGKEKNKDGLLQGAFRDLGFSTHFDLSRSLVVVCKSIG
ncbi:hypothetical protein, partial [Salmonella enterica]|uniref:hypothetical protein n=1 Tax=Salmonella enterica TaxID=28901 RepID=UPI0020C2DD68